jgi:exodeoxyribonuclease VII small subunit
MPASHSENKSEIAAPASDEDVSFDQVLDRLRQVVQRLEQGSLPLDQALKAFEEGVRLSRRGSAILDAAEQRVELLLREDDGTEKRQPLGSSPGAGEPRPASS